MGGRPELVEDLYSCVVLAFFEADIDQVALVPGHFSLRVCISAHNASILIGHRGGQRGSHESVTPV